MAGSSGSPVPKVSKILQIRNLLVCGHVKIKDSILVMQPRMIICRYHVYVKSNRTGMAEMMATMCRVMKPVCKNVCVNVVVIRLEQHVVICRNLLQHMRMVNVFARVAKSFQLAPMVMENVVEKVARKIVPKVKFVSVEKVIVLKQIIRLRMVMLTRCVNVRMAVQTVHW